MLAWFRNINIPIKLFVLSLAKQFRRTTGLLLLIVLVLTACQTKPATGTSTQVPIAEHTPIPTEPATGTSSTQVPTAESTPVPSPLERGFKFYADNPVLPLGPSDSWDSGLLDPGAVVFHNGKFHMFYNAIPYWPAQIAVGYAVSPDGIAWTRIDTQPVFTIDDVQWQPKPENIQATSVIVEDDTWVLYFSVSYSASSATGVIGRATASSPTGPWSVDPEPVLEPGETGEWDTGSIGKADIIQTDKGYVMYYSNPAGIGMATSPDGKQWVKYNDPHTVETAFAKSDPVIELFAVENPTVAQTSWGWAMVYLSNNALNYATSLDGVNWLDAPDNPIISLPEKYIWYSSLVIHDDTAYLFIEVGTSSKTGPYLATWQEASTPSPTGTPISMITDNYGVPMILVPAGPFEMGADADIALVECRKFYGSCPRDWFTSEEPVHSVMLDDYYIDQYEVTNACYAACVDEGVCNPPILTDDLSRGEYYGSSTYADYPVLFINWHGAQTYCQWRGARLPTEAEWEKAARGGLEGKFYPWGDTFDGERVNFCDRNCEFSHANQDYDDGHKNTAPVGSYAPNGYGLYDMAGNVWEWVADWYDEDYYANSPDSNPGGPASGQYRVLRGGSWYNHFGFYYRAALRYKYDPSSQYSIVGFRCARSS